MEYGLIGGKLGHSYSKTIHELLCGYSYELCPLPTEADARAFLQRRQFKAINVTIPYKKLVMEYCSFIDPRARAIGAVNTVVNKNGLLYGYNTDYLGFAHLCEAHGVELAGKTVLILGTGGTHNTTRAVALDKGAAKVLTVSRTPDPEKGELSYAEAVHSGAQVVFNTTPAGMYPNVGVCSLDVAAMPGLEAVVDVVYNPNKTELILCAEEAGVPVAVGGLEMLVAQAVYAAEYFLGRKFEDAPAEVRRITAALRRETLNIALVGMPSCGKSTLGRLLAKQLGRPLVDLDEEIVKADGRSIPDIFAAEGEEGFRAKESAQIARFGKEKGLVLSCGGGAVKRAENVRALRQNGVVLFIDRPVEALAVGGDRPLSSSAEALRTMEAQRRPLYLAAADAVVPNTGTLAETLAAAQGHWMKFLILNGPNINLARWSEPGVPGEVDYTGLMDYVQAGCDQLGIETDICQSNHEGDLIDEIQSAPGRVDGIVLNPGGYAHYSVAILDALRLCSVPAVEVMLDAPDEREPFRKTDVVSFGCQGHFIGEGPQGYLHACIWLAQLLRTDGSSKAHIVM